MGFFFQYTATETSTDSLSCENQKTLACSVELKVTENENARTSGQVNDSQTIATDSKLDECMETSTKNERLENFVGPVVQNETESSTTTKDKEHDETSNKESDSCTNGENGSEEMETGDNMCDDDGTPTKIEGLLTSDMISEEQRLKERALRESSSEGREVSGMNCL